MLGLGSSYVGDKPKFFMSKNTNPLDPIESEEYNCLYQRFKKLAMEHENIKPEEWDNFIYQRSYYIELIRDGSYRGTFKDGLSFELH